MMKSADAKPRWDYQPTGPFYVYRLGRWFHGDLELEEAVALFAANSIPVEDQEISAVMDNDDVVVVGYIAATGKVMWWGLKAGFDALEASGEVDPIDQVLWQIEAKANMDGISSDGHV